MSYSAYLYTTMINDFIRDVIGEPVTIAASDYSAAYAVMGHVFDPSLYKKMLLIAPAGVSKGFELPSVPNLFAKWFLETPVLGTAAYNLISKPAIGRQIFKVLHGKQALASNMPSQVRASAFYGGPNARMPIAALLCKFLNVNIRVKLGKLKLPVLILSKKNYGLTEDSMTVRIRDFLN
jgi:pimeloyl-ACP methyl ester carboxylesterase